MYIFLGAFIYTTIGIILCKVMYKKTKAFEEDDTGFFIFICVLLWPGVIVIISIGVIGHVLRYIVTGKED